MKFFFQADQRRRKNEFSILRWRGKSSKTKKNNILLKRRQNFIFLSVFIPWFFWNSIQRLIEHSNS